ncbi:MAG: HPr family phosphocarrier protein [Eubacteriales bacterium]|nr:HPr family phosphocarrier protein [Eubacteriales bacterium]
MLKKSVVFHCEEDMEMKAVAMLIQKASTFSSSLWLQTGERRANAKSLLGVMSLGISDGCSIEISADGADENEAVDEIGAYLEAPTFN